MGSVRLEQVEHQIHTAVRCQTVDQRRPTDTFAANQGLRFALARKFDRLRTALRAEVGRRSWRGAYRLDLIALDFEAAGRRLVLEHFRGL